MCVDVQVHCYRIHTQVFVHAHQNIYGTDGEFKKIGGGIQEKLEFGLSLLTEQTTKPMRNYHMYIYIYVPLKGCKAVFVGGDFARGGHSTRG